MKQSIIIFLLFIVIIGLWGYSGFWIYTSFENTERGSIGDMFGAVNALFSGLALTGIIITIYLQQKELSLQRKELQQTREVFQKQKFENTFFNLASLHHEILSGIKYEFTIISSKNGEETSRTKYEYIGRDFFDYIEKELTKVHTILENYCVGNHRLNSSDINLSKTKRTYKLTDSWFKGIDYDFDLNRKNERVLQADKVIFSTFQVKYAHYFRHLYQILKYIKKNQEKEISLVEENNTILKKEIINLIKDRYKEYANFIQAQMSTAELFVLFYNSLKFDKMVAIIEEYDFVENLPIENLINENHQEFYNVKLKSNKDKYK